MLMYGTSMAIPIVDVGKTMIYSITSLNESLPVLHLIPPNQLGYLVDYDFDVAYFNWIINDKAAFYDFFTIVNHLYLGQDVLLVFSNDLWSENLAESILKLIQERYGYNGVLITSIDDYIQANHMDFNFNREWGLYNLDQDKQRFGYQCESMRLANGGKPYMEEGDWPVC